MSTERISRRFVDLDAWETSEALDAMLEGQLSAIAAVRPALTAIGRAVDEAAARLGETGRLVYLGAGTSGRIAVQDGAELTPTFDWPRERLVFAIAGGMGALVASAEGAEDDEAAARAAMDEAAVGPADVVIGVAASGATPYTIAGIARARETGALTIGIANNRGARLLAAAEHAILLETGGELIAGSTRMKAGTAQKATLNLISTGIMLRLGRVYRGMMVNMRAANAKLRRRAEVIVAEIAGCGDDDARAALARGEGDIKVASLVALGAEPEAARSRLAECGGNLRLALAALQ
ncbi:N-acetylmuramic acid 6-phosphate etherase [Salinarimonas ramus]|uniref:N-acetylmuramic acid 6-phosphate etherase n=1 Tax=Salinarimonas ramus TaxID=690164 RepID=A0A917QGI6_9HYPH|nr:N-acetylmuramic acid 6-phosphate etherase [Salinarimonas ramus]GGK48741.1 N-acetylmuramic acid 6-phosphate etherase [Salinarimonas ramus]